MIKKMILTNTNKFFPHIRENVTVEYIESMSNQNENPKNSRSGPITTADRIAFAVREVHRGFWRRALRYISMAEYIQKTGIMKGEDPRELAEILHAFTHSLPPEMQAVLQLYMIHSQEAPNIMRKIAEGLEADTAVDELLRGIDGIAAPDPSKEIDENEDEPFDSDPMIVAVTGDNLNEVLARIAETVRKNRNQTDTPPPEDTTEPQPDVQFDTSDLPEEMKRSIELLQNPKITQVLSTIAFCERLRASGLHKGKTYEEVQDEVYELLTMLTPEVQAGFMYYVKLYQEALVQMKLIRQEAENRGISKEFDPNPLIRVLGIQTYSSRDQDDTDGRSGERDPKL